MVRHTENTGLLTTDSSGAATFTTQLVEGVIEAVIIKLGTTTSVDVKIAPNRLSVTSAQIVNMTSITGDITLYPRLEINGPTGTASLAASNKTNVFTRFAVSDHLVVTIANGGSAKTLSVQIIYEK